MNQLAATLPSRQRGMATLAISLIILILVTLVTLYTANTAVTEQRISANQYRADQAFSAASAALDYAIAYVDDAGGADKDDDGVPDSGVQPIAYANGSTRNATWALDDVDLPLTITAVGFSDDGSAQRTIVQRISPLNLNGDGPEQPLIARESVGITGNARITNKYTTTSIWSGGEVGIGNSNSAETLIADPANPPITDPDAPGFDADTLFDPLENTIHSSGRDTGNNADILDEDPTLGNLTADEFWENFFDESRSFVREAADAVDQMVGADELDTLENASETDVTSGIIWAEGDQSITGGIYGSAEEPVLMVINGHLRSTGNLTVWGLVYIVNGWTKSGTPRVNGAVIVESGDVDGAGTVDVFYYPDVLGSGAGGTGESGVVLGSWRDW